MGYSPYPLSRIFSIKERPHEGLDLTHQVRVSQLCPDPPYVPARSKAAFEAWISRKPMRPRYEKKPEDS